MLCRNCVVIAMPWSQEYEELSCVQSRKVDVWQCIIGGSLDSQKGTVLFDKIPLRRGTKSLVEAIIFTQRSVCTCSTTLPWNDSVWKHVDRWWEVASTTFFCGTWKKQWKNVHSKSSVKVMLLGSMIVFVKLRTGSSALQQSKAALHCIAEGSERPFPNSTDYGGLW